VAEQSKKIFFFDKIFIPKSFESKLELFQLNLIIILWYLAKKDSGKKISFNLIQMFICDLEYAIRELGVSDLSVGKKVKFMVSSYYGRANTYQKALIKNSKIMDEALKNNLYGTIAPKKNEVKYMKSYINNLMTYLAFLKNSGVLICFQNNINLFEGLLDE